MKSAFFFIFLFLLVLTPFVFAESFGYNNPNLPKLVQEFFGGKPFSFFMPNNKSVFGNFSFDGTCLNGGVEIKEGTICAQILQVFNITNLNITRQSLTILDNLTVQGNITADNFIGTHSGNSSIWSRAGTNTFLTNSGDNVGINTSTPQNTLNVVGDSNFTENATFMQDVTILGTLFGGSPVKISGGLNVTGNLNAIDNLTIFEYFFLDSDYSIPPGQNKILKRNSATKAVFGVQNTVADASSDTGAGYVLNTSVGEYRIDLHSYLDTQNPNDTVHHLLGSNNREIWRLNPSSDSSFRFEGGLDSEIVIINRTGLFVTGNLSVDTNTLFVDAVNNRVGIGTTTPQAFFDVSSNLDPINGAKVITLANVQLRVMNSVGSTGDGSGIKFGVSSVNGNPGGGAIVFERTGSNAQGRLHFATKETTSADSTIPIRMTIANDGKIGINETNPIKMLHIEGFDPQIYLHGTSGDAFESGRIRLAEKTSGGGENFKGGFIHFDGSTNKFNIGVHDPGDQNVANDVNAITIDRTSAEVEILNLGSSGATDVCRNSGNALSTCSSSERYKKNIRTLPLGLETIMQLRSVTFNWKDTNNFDLGFIAEEVEKINPLLVTYHPDKNQTSIEGVKYKQITAVLVNAIKQQQEQIEKLKVEIYLLNNRISQIEERLK